MDFFSVFFFLGVLVHSNNALYCKSCDKSFCSKPVNCTAGLVKGICGCCDVCAKANGERCGGMWNMEGRCGKRLKCVPKPWMKEENEFLPAHFRTGICETDPCENNNKCGFRKTCKINKRGQPVCTCPRNCGKLRRPVCGLLNGKQYRNRCKLSREECLTNKEIGMLPGRCKKCSFQGRTFKFGTARDVDVAPCETCICRHGSWKCQIKPNCSSHNVPNNFEITNDKQTCLMSKDGKHVVLPCQKGFLCRLRRSDDKPEVVRIGICKKKKVSKPKTVPLLLEINNDVDIWGKQGENIPAQVEMHLTDLVNTESWLTSTAQPTLQQAVYKPTTERSQSRQDQPTAGNGLIQRVCMAEPDKRICQYSHSTRWFYNATSETCEPFQYGGCNGNFNNFVSKEECDNVCHPGIVDIPPGPMTQSSKTRDVVPAVPPFPIFGMCHDVKTKKSYHDGERWNRDKCTTCSCANGVELCFATVCQSCAIPIYVDGKCCPICKEREIIHPDYRFDMVKRSCKDPTTGLQYNSGESWKDDACSLCTCFDGKISCMESSCATPKCNNPIKKEDVCCPICPDNEKKVSPTTSEIDIKCQDKESGKFYSLGEGWVVNDCMSCFCGKDGQSTCRELTCPSLNCKNPVYLQERCCPICPDSFFSACSYNNQQYFKDDFILLGDMCTLCKCNGKKWNCTERLCNGTENRISVTSSGIQQGIRNSEGMTSSLSGHAKSQMDDFASDQSENNDFIMEDPSRMSWHTIDNPTKKLDEIPNTSTQNHLSNTPSIKPEPGMKTHEVNNEHLKNASTTQLDTDSLGLQSKEEPKNIDTGPHENANNDTVVYRTKRL